MPVTKSAKKAMRQAKTRTERNKPIKSKVKTVIKNLLILAKTDKAAAEKELSNAYKVIDLATKKHLLHSKTAARRKSRLARAIANSGKVTEAVEKKPKKAPAVKKPAKKK